MEDQLVDRATFIKEGRTVMSTFLFPNGMIVTCGTDGKQIPFLQGKYTRLLHEDITKYSDAKTQWNGYEAAK
jgi:hypothetical protein